MCLQLKMVAEGKGKMQHSDHKLNQVHDSMFSFLRLKLNMYRISKVDCGKHSENDNYFYKCQ